MEKMHNERYMSLLKIMRDKGWDCVILWPSPNMYYITGYYPKPDERLQIAFIPVQGDPILIVPRLYSDESKHKCWIRDQRSWQDGDDTLALVMEVVKELGLTDARIALDDTMGFLQVAPIQKACPRAEFGMASAVISPLRFEKGPEEIKLMHKSCQISDEVMQIAIDECLSGKNEQQLVDLVEYELRKRGMADGFSNLVASGPHSALPHHVSSHRVPQKGDAVFFDIGGAYERYWSDITRTIHIGSPTTEFIEAYEAVKEAQQRAKEAVKPGVTAEEVHRVAFEHLEKKDLSKYFFHRVGHGMGLEGHEHHSINWGNKLILKPGMAFSVEPGVYIEGKFGIRIEDTVVVTETGHKSLSEFPRDLIVL